MQPTPGLPLKHLLLALAVVTVWGTNFVIIRAGLQHLPPFLFGALRFTLAFLPALFLPRPRASWASLAGYGLLIGAGQFALLYYAMRRDISPGLASLVLQTQVFFTIGFAVPFAGETVRRFQWLALLLAASGILVIGLNTDASSVTPFGLALSLLAALSWAGGNTVARSAGVRDMLPFVVWSSLFAAPPLFLLSLFFEGWPLIRDAVGAAGPAVWAAVLWQTAGNTLFGYAAWGWLLSRHPAASITPTALLVPVVGMATSALVLGEGLPAWKLAAAALVIGGLSLGILYPRWLMRQAAPAA